MITDSSAAQQIIRFKASAGWTGRAEDEVVISELMRALKAEAKSNEDAKMIVTKCLEFGTFVPTPADIARAAEVVHSAQRTWTNENPSCEACVNSPGYVTVTRNVPGYGTVTAAQTCPRCRGTRAVSA